MPGPDFNEDNSGPSLPISLSDSTELWLIQWPLDQTARSATEEAVGTSTNALETLSDEVQGRRTVGGEIGVIGLGGTVPSGEKKSRLVIRSKPYRLS
ncbi:hypothetical protein KSP39_PZI000981 [Platanthera zijinensis]|uniref:Uncharacterized protein n=1 Tax=Platanthera zijinensis TaxID=2320716 RepID=A0AAP0GG64_9ASPA